MINKLLVDDLTLQITNGIYHMSIQTINSIFEKIKDVSSITLISNETKLRYKIINHVINKIIQNNMTPYIFKIETNINSEFIKNIYKSFEKLYKYIKNKNESIIINIAIDKKIINTFKTPYFIEITNKKLQTRPINYSKNFNPSYKTIMKNKYDYITYDYIETLYVNVHGHIYPNTNYNNNTQNFLLPNININTSKTLQELIKQYDINNN